MQCLRGLLRPARAGVASFGALDDHIGRTGESAQAHAIEYASKGDAKKVADVAGWQ